MKILNTIKANWKKTSPKNKRLIKDNIALTVAGIILVLIVRALCLDSAALFEWWMSLPIFAVFIVLTNLMFALLKD